MRQRVSLNPALISGCKLPASRVFGLVQVRIMGRFSGNLGLCLNANRALVVGNQLTGFPGDSMTVNSQSNFDANSPEFEGIKAGAGRNSFFQSCLGSSSFAPFEKAEQLSWTNSHKSGLGETIE